MTNSPVRGNPSRKITGAASTDNARGLNPFEDYRARTSENTHRRQMGDLLLFAQSLASAGIIQECRDLDHDTRRVCIAPHAAQLSRSPDAWIGITHQQIAHFVQWQLAEGYSIGSINVRLSTVKRYAELAHQAGVINEDAYRLIRTVRGYGKKHGSQVDQKRASTRLSSKKAQPIILAEEQARALKQQQDTPQGRRDALLMCLLLDHGLRVGEIVGLKVRDFHLAQGTLTFYRSQVGKVQTHSLTPDTLRAARVYMEHDAPISQDDPVLRGSVKGGVLSGTMTDRAVNYRVETLGKVVGIEDLSPHDLRHTWATYQARVGVSLDRLKNAGGWDSYAMPLRYVEDARIADKGLSDNIYSTEEGVAPVLTELSATQTIPDEHDTQRALVRSATSPESETKSDRGLAPSEQWSLSADEQRILQLMTGEQPFSLRYAYRTREYQADKSHLEAMTARELISEHERKGNTVLYVPTQAGMAAVGQSVTGVSVERYIPEQPSAKGYTVNGYPASGYQAAILERVEHGTGDIFVVAAAGSGKSSTLVEAIRRAPVEPASVLALAFNRHIYEELRERLKGTRYAAQTIHSVGYQVLAKHLNLNEADRVNGRKYSDLARQWVEASAPLRRDERFNVYDARDTLKELCDFVRLTLTEYRSRAAIRALSDRFGITRHGEEWLFDGVAPVLDAGEQLAREQHMYDFTDMLWLPYTWKLPMPQMKFITVDEAQDLNALQRELVLRMRAPGGRILWVGDPDQSIMGFSGADVNSFNEIKLRTNAEVLPLSISYRCPLKHIQLAQELVPTIEARPGAPQGTVETIGEQTLLQLAQPGDMILCRRTAPLVKTALKFIATGRQARVRGQENMGKSLSGMVELIVKRTHCTFESFERGIDSYRSMERKRLAGRENSEGQLQTLDDKLNSLRAFYQNSDARDLNALSRDIERLFEDTSNAITLSTVHRAKGLEADRVFILQPDSMPLVWKNQQDWEYEQELHIKYIALTRAKSTLYFVEDAEQKKKKE
jgi:DNA helicase II / ATP-dependent DNA helicase PcrA